MFRNFKDFKSHLRSQFGTLSEHLRPLNPGHAMSKVWSTAFRLPTYLLEPKFLTVFGKTESDFEDRESIALLAKVARETSSKAAAFKPVNSYFAKAGNFSKIKDAAITVNKLLRIWGQKFVPVHPKVAVTLLPHNTSSGYPEFKTPKSELSQYVSNQAITCFANGDTSWLNFLTTMAWRTQVRLKSIKFRIIWVTSYLSQVFEMCFFAPFQQHFTENKDTPYCFGNVWTDLVPRIKQLRSCKTVVVIDFSAYDQSIVPELMYCFFSSIKSCLKIFNKNWNLQYQAVVDFNVTGNCFNILDGMPTIFSKHGSISSGSVFTNFIGSWINLFLICLYLIELGKDPFKQCLNVMGDDCMFGFDFDFNIIDYSAWLESNFGMIVSVEKSQVLSPNFDRIEFLGSEMNESGRYINVELAIRQLVISNHFIPESVMSESIRLISKAASICFKFSDGHLFFDDIMYRLMPLLNLSSLPDTYFELFYSAAGPFDMYVIHNLSEYKYKGWMFQ